LIRYGLLCAVVVFLALPSFAQYSANLQGTVLDPAGAAVNGAHLRLVNLSNGVEAKAVSNATGGYRFLSLAPGRYNLETQSAGFGKSSISLTLDTNQTLDIPVKLAIAQANTVIAVTTEAPLLDVAETRNELTIETDAMSALPLPSRNLVSLVNMAPGMTGLGLVASSTPGSGVDNYSTETQVDSSANGQGAVGNLYIVDDLDITSAIRPGVLNLTPNSDSVQEASIQVNTYTVDYGRASGVQMVMTTKAGGDKFHGSANELYNTEQMWGINHYQNVLPKFHSDNMSATIGGPIVPHHQAFFFFAIEPLRSAKGTSGVITVEDPAFTSYAESNFASTIGTSLLKSFPVTGAIASVNQTASTYFANNSGSGTCGTVAGGGNGIPCSTPVLDNVNFAAAAPRNGMQWNGRLDKSFKNDRVYGNFYRTTLTTGTPFARTAFNETSGYWTIAWQGNETHTFSPNTINEAIGGGMRVEGIQPQTGDFKVPVVNVGGLGTGFGDGFALGDFIQHNYHWRDVLTHIHGAHTFKAGFEGWFGDDVELFQGPYDLPTFTFNTLLSLAQDAPQTEGGVAYNPLTGNHIEWKWNAASRTYGLFVEDTWKARKNLTLNYGVRWDDFGNPYSRDLSNTVFGNFYLGGGLTLNQQVANGTVHQTTHALDHSITDIFSPRLGYSWDVASNSKWVLHGGVGIFHNWPTMANEQEQYRGNPPGGIYPTFYATATPTSPALIWGLGTTNTPPFGFTYPQLPAETLTAAGGVTGLTFGIGGIDPNLKSPVAYIYSTQLEHPLNRIFVASVGFSGANARRQLSGGGQVYSVSYGVDINTFPGDLVSSHAAHPNLTQYCKSPSTGDMVACQVLPYRLNQNFGSIYYTQNDRHSNFDAVFADLRARFASGSFIDISYTHSQSKDDTQVYPTWQNPQQYYGPSNWDVPNRISATGNYQYKGLNSGRGPLGRATGGWGVSSTLIMQSGNPFTIVDNNAFYPTCGTLANPNLECTVGVPWTGNSGGDYNEDGNTGDYPNVSSYSQTKSRNNWLPTSSGGIAAGTIASTQWARPAYNTGEGNEKFNAFRGPSFFETNASLIKDTTVRNSIKLQFRMDVFNIFNNSNFNSVDNNVRDGNFGKATNQYEARWMQVGIGFKF
jgi:hypothetical protein